MTTNVYIWPFYRGEDKGDGGIRRVVEGQVAHLGKYDVEVVPNPEDADVLACHVEAPWSIVNKYPDKPLVAHCHGLYWSEYEWLNWALKANSDVMNLIRAADVVTAPSEWVAQTLKRHTLRRVISVHHGVDTDVWKPSKENGGYVLWNKTRPDPVCDPSIMQNIARLLPDVQFISTIGDEQDNVKIVGRHSYEKSMQYVREAGLYLATARETFGVGTIEALACGVPVVGFDWGGNSEIITHKVDGWLARPESLESLLEGIEYCREHREELSRNARETAQRFSWDGPAKQYAGIYHALAKQRQRRGVPKVSVVVTAYNLDKYLNACLRSVAESSFRDFECIVVDDASPDECGKIADQWAEVDSRFRVIHNSENLYLAGSRNVGIQAARGKYILPLDADDRLDQGAIGVLADALDKERSIHIAYGGVRFVNIDGDSENNEYIHDGHSGWPIEYNFDLHVYNARNLLPYCSMFKKEVWDNTGGYRTRLKTGEDADFWIRAASYGFLPKMVTKQDTLIYTIRPDSMSHENREVLWPQWYPWIENHELTPAAAVTNEQLPVSSLDPRVIEVVIPCGPGHERYLMDAIDSVDAQTFRNFSCTVVNDTGSPFDFPIPSWVKVIDTTFEPMGPARARNAAIALSKCVLFIPLDADDYLQPHALQVMFNAWISERKIVYGDFFEDPQEENVFTIFQSDDYDPNIILRHCLHPVTALTPKEYWEKVGGYDPHIVGWEDWAFQLACAEAGICSVHVRTPVFTYRKHTGKRREDAYRNYEDGRASMVSRFGQYWEGVPLMACRSCGGSRSFVPASQPAFSRAPAAEGATKMFNPVGGVGGITHSAPESGRKYRFTGKGWQYVLSSDVPHFASLGFEVYHEVEVPQAITTSSGVKKDKDKEKSGR